MKMILWMWLLVVSVSMAGDRYILVKLDASASQQTKEEFRKWIMSLPKEEWHGIDKWDTKDTNRVWFVNLDITKPSGKCPPLSVTALTAKDQICEKLTTAEKSKVTTESRSATAEAPAK